MLSRCGVLLPSELNDGLARVAEAGAGSLLLIGGDAERPRGPFCSAQAIPETGLPARHGFRRIGVGGHPGGPPVNRNGHALLGDLGRHSPADPSLPIASVHIFPFGGLRGSVKWLDAMREPRIETAAAVGAGGAQP